MKKTALLVAALCLCAPLRAQSIPDIFGVQPGDIIGQAERLREQYEKHLAEERIRRARRAWMGELVGVYAVPRQEARCVLHAVAWRLGVAVPAGEPPAIVRLSRTIFEDYQDVYYSEFGKWPASRTVAPGYFPVSNVIFLDDAAKGYGPRRGIDDAVAEQLALFVQYRAFGRAPDSPEAKAVAADVGGWFHAAYTVRGADACR